jgi:hypothetical protein
VNTTGEVCDNKWTPLLDTLARQADISHRTAYRELKHLQQHGWFVRYVTANRAKVAGLLMVGHECDCAGVIRTCRGPGCGKPLTSSRADARFCSPRCQRAGHRFRNRGKPAPIAQTNRPGASAISPDMSDIKSRHVCDKEQTRSASSPDKAMVTAAQNDISDVENAVKRTGDENRVSNEQQRAPWSRGLPDWPPGSNGEWENR